MKPLKIIHLSGFSIHKPPQHPAKGSDNYFVSSWAGLIARRLKQYKPELDIEIWRAENDFDEKSERDIFSIKGVIWPYKKPLVKNLLTLSMVKRLNILKNYHSIILHYHDLFNVRFVILISLICPEIKLVLSHHGGIPPGNSTVKSLLMRLFYNKQNISHITYLSLRAKIFLESIKQHPPLEFLPVGGDYNQFKPLNKDALRKELGLDPSKIYGIYVGKFYKLKSVELILNSIEMLKSKYNFSVIFVGGSNSPENDLYNEVINSGCPWYNATPWTEMVNFYNAADFYIHPAFHPAFGGLDVSWIEALACNKPVLSPQLAYLDFDNSELGVLINNREEIVEKTELMINTYKTFTKCREVSQKQLDGNTAIMEKLIQIYDKTYC
jgi:glycosyltransferase involved in cell wall biosynthesis